MSHAAIKATGKRFAFTAIRITLDINDPALDDTFALQADSYGTPKTTDNANAYTGTDFRQYVYSDQQLFGIDHFSGLKRVTSSPPRIDPGKSIGLRATATAVIKDFISQDIFELPSPYDDRRVTGSHFLKLLARNHVKNRRIEIIRGFNPFDYDETNAEIESYVIDSISQPNENGDVSIKMIDELILTESSKAKAPAISSGSVSVLLTDVSTLLTFTTPITEEYGAVSATGSISIEKEIMTYTVATSTTMNIARAQNGTEAAQHEVGETVQKCLVFDDENIIDIITGLINDYTKIDSSYIPMTDWAALKTGDLANYNLTRVLYKPIDVKKLLNELIQIAGLSMYVDVIDDSIVIVAVPDFASPEIELNDDQHLGRGSVNVQPSYKDQITRQAIWWDKRDATESNDEKNYRKKFLVGDLIVEGDADIGSISVS